MTTTAEPTPTELRNVVVADVHKRGRLAARLRREVDGVVFEYLDDYLADFDAPAVATTLPRSPEPVRTGSAGAVPAFFAGLLPEGRRLGALQRAVKTSADDDLTLLLAVGEDTVGDVKVVSGGKPLNEERAALDVADWSGIDFADLYTQLTGERLDPARAGIPGVQVKVSARMVNLPVRRSGERFILKLNPPEYPHLVENEDFFLDAARRSGLPVANTEIVRDRDGRSGLLVTRFDRVADANGVRMLAQEDACQVLGRYPADKYNLTSEDVVRGLASVAQARPVAARDLVRQLAFAYLTGNGDAHAKNFSIVQTPSGEWRVTPAYDVPSSYPYGDVTMALPIDAKRDERIGRADFLVLGEQSGLRARATERLLDELVERVDLWLPGLAALPFDGRILHKLRRSVEYRRGRLGDRGASREVRPMAGLHVGILGAGGVGIATAGAVIQQGLGGRVTIYARNADQARGEALDFLHARPLLPHTEIRGLGIDELEPEDVLVITVGAHTKPGESRLDILGNNLQVVSAAAEAIERGGLPRVAIVVSNPLDVLTEFLIRRWDGKPVAVMGSGTSLDTLRFQERVAQECGVHPRSTHAWVIGEHGDSQVFLYESATIGALPLRVYAEQRGLDITPEWHARIERDVRNAAYTVRELKGSTRHGIALAVSGLIRCIGREHGTIIPVSVRVADDVCASLPCVLGPDGPGAPLWPEMNDAERAAWENSLDVIRKLTASLPF